MGVIRGVPTSVAARGEAGYLRRQSLPVGGF